MRNHPEKQLIISILFLPSIILGGTLGYVIIEGWSFFDALYMTIITISTTGYGEIHKLSIPGRLFSMFLIISGVISIAYIGGRAFQLIIETEVFRRRRMSKKIEDLKDHYIVGGYGRMGKYICETLKVNSKPFVIIENDKEKIDEILDKGMLFINGDSTNDENMLKAGIKRASGFIAVLGNDADNVFSVLSANELNPELFIVARAIDEGTDAKLKRAGADRVVKPYELGGNRMVQLLLRPGVMDFIDVIARKSGQDIHLEEVTICKDSELIGKTLAESPIRNKLNIMIVAILRAEDFIYNPKSSAVIQQNDRLIAIGESGKLTQLMEMCIAK